MIVLDPFELCACRSTVFCQGGIGYRGDWLPPRSWPYRRSVIRIDHLWTARVKRNWQGTGIKAEVKSRLLCFWSSCLLLLEGSGWRSGTLVRAQHRRDEDSASGSWFQSGAAVCLLQAFGTWASEWKLSSSLSLQLSFCPSDKQEIDRRMAGGRTCPTEANGVRKKWEKCQVTVTECCCFLTSKHAFLLR